ncbi:MAG: phosphate ABC transporter ATP-binding protein [Syntrophaceae bacterium]|nr:phosphate ABC transporter ATP-binding protein [Syntrophaceae bacterium]
MSHIRIRNLSISYGGHRVLQDISLDIPDRQIIAIIGPSGCGKTTLLKSLNRLLDLYDSVTVEGDVLIDGLNIYDRQADLLALRKKVGFLSQRPYPLPMSIYDNIAFGPRIHRVGGAQIRKRIEELERSRELLLGNSMEGERSTARKKRGNSLDRLVEYYLNLAGLWDEVKDRLHAPASRLSIGQQQRLALARAIAVDPEVILADEPTSALDPVSARLVEKQFQFLKKDYTIVVVTHILRQARRMADYIVFLYMGELVEHGPAAEFFNAPRDERTRAYISGEIS